MTILYKVHNNLYVNLTNKCPCSCTFCLRQTMDHVGESDSLWLTREPEYEEIIADFANFNVDAFDEEAQCQAICDQLGVTYRIRPWES